MLPEFLRQVLDAVRQRCKSHPLLEWLIEVVVPIDDLINNKPLRAVFTKSSNLWPCGTKNKPLHLPYSFFKPADNSIQRHRQSKIQTVIHHIEQKVQGVKFVHVNQDSDAVIRIAFNRNHADGKTWSRVGREAEDIDYEEPTMNLSEVTGLESGDIQDGSDEYADVVHEFFHALGMLHEHQHPKRKFTLSETAVIEDLAPDGWSEEAIRDNVVRRLNPREIGAFSPPDAASSMNYNISSRWTRNGSEVTKNDKPSDLDFVWLNLMYPPQEQRKFEQALSESMNGRIKEHWNSLLKLYSDGKWGKLRSEITRLSNPKSMSSTRE